MTKPLILRNYFSFAFILFTFVSCHIENENEVHFGPGPGFPVHTLDNSSEVKND